MFFPKLMGEANAERILGREGWTPTGEEARDLGVVLEVASEGKLLERAQAIAEEWIATNKPKSFNRFPKTDELAALLTATNARESVDLSQAFLSERFLQVCVLHLCLRLYLVQHARHWC